MKDYLSEYELWQSNVTQKDLKSELDAMKYDNKRIEDAFYKTLEFGTAGLRGVMGAGTNRMNQYIIKQTTLAITKYLTKNGGDKKAVITYDSRINSEKFAHLTASIFASNNVKVYITNGCKPTPYLSFLVGLLKADVGINITSSHNPKEYNGYKVYDEQGCQIGEEVAEEISEIRECINPFEINEDDFDELKNLGKIEYVDDENENKYITTVLKQRVFKGDINNEIKIVYTALNGVGAPFAKRIFKEIGFSNAVYVQEQMEPNGNFTTCPYPNPELDDAISLAVQYAKKNNADYVLATDPDSDRLSVAYREKGTDNFRHLTGNEIGVLFAEFIFRNLKMQDKLPVNPVVVRSIVTTPWVDNIVKEYGGIVKETYTGFKNLCGEIRKLELNGEVDRAILAFEDACGYLKGSYVRDKDGVLACMLFMELLSEITHSNISIEDRLNEIKSRFGAYESKLYSVRFEGLDGEKQKNNILKHLRENEIETIGGQKVVKKIDFLNQTEYDLPASNVLKYIFESGDDLIIRPSGTEPLLKCYINIKGGNLERLDLICKDIKYIFTGENV